MRSVRANMPRMFLPQIGHRFIRGRDGAAMLEFALVAPVMVGFVFLIIDLCLMFFIVASVEGGLREATRYAITGAAFGGLTREQRIAKMVKDSTYGLVAASDIVITYKIYPSFGDVGKPEPFTDVNGNGIWDADMGKDGTGSSGEIVNYTVDYKHRLLTPFVTNFWGSDHVSLRAVAAVRNEPY
jgi:Flp pilus assembly pilin Flp